MDTSLPPELVQARDEIVEYARSYGLDFFDTIFEMVDYDEINSLASLEGFPVRYPHWRFGMNYDQMSKGYEWGMQKIYEMVINTDPSYAYLLRSNPMVDQKMVMAHVYGHVDFFKNNQWFSKTNRKMLDTMANHAVRIRNYMDIFGQDTVESFIDQCLSIDNLIDPHLPFQVKSIEDSKPEEEKDSQPGKIRVERSYMESFINPKEFLDEQKKRFDEQKKVSKRVPEKPEKDVLKFLIDYAPLEQWQSDVLSIIRDEAYYFAPQRQTKIMNEGWASYWHSKIMTQKALKDSEILDFAQNHAGAMAMSPGRINPYKIGIELFRDIEDRWNRGAFGKEYDECTDLQVKFAWDKKLGKGKEKIFQVRRVDNDITFIDNYLTEEFVDRYQLYTYEFNRRTNQFEIAERDFKKVKEKLLNQLTNMGQPFIFVSDLNFENRGELLLWHHHQGIDLDLRWAKETMSNISKIWNRPVNLQTESENQKKLLTYSSGEFKEKLI